MSNETSAIDLGRQDLADWQASQPDNFFTADGALQRSLQRLWGNDKYNDLMADFTEFGRLCAQEIDPLVQELEYRGNMPRIERFDGVGRRVERVIYDGNYHAVGRLIYGSGAMRLMDQPGSMLHSWSYLLQSNKNGEAGHNCPLVCTAGVVRCLSHAGNKTLKERYLPGLTDSSWDSNLTGAQFMTEVQGGSDVGANATTATLVDEDKGLWQIHGEKWFCSNASADLMLMTARIEDAPEGTRGLGLFLVPRILDDGSLNHFVIRRLKEKLGTRAMASGEFDFDGALAWHMGPVGDGFKTMMNHVINVSRLSNAGGVLAMAWRAMVTAWHYAQHRQAFGGPIANYPLVQESLVQMRSEYAVLLNSAMDLVDLRDKMDLGQNDEIDDGYFRVFINLNKYRTAVSAAEIIRTSLELLGGNGAIESFSVIPRMLRDNIVYENWEGTHNTLMMQVLRDMARLGVAEPFMAQMKRRFESLQGGALAHWTQPGLQAVAALGEELAALHGCGAELASLRMRPVADRMAWLAAAASFAQQAAWEQTEMNDGTAEQLLTYFWQRRIETAETAPEQNHLDVLRRLSAAI